MKWEKKKLGDVAEIKYGKDHKRLNVGTVPVYGSGGIMKYVDTALYNKKSVLIPRKGSLGNLFFVQEPFWTVDTLFYTKIDDSQVVPEYLYYKLKTYDLTNMNVGSAVPSLTTAILNSLEIELPDLVTQGRIVSVLKAFDEKISLNRKINHYLEQMATSIWQEHFDDSEINGTLGDIATISSGKRPPIKSSEITGHMVIPILGANSIMGYTNQNLYDEKILVTGRVGTHGVIQRYNRPCWVSDNALVLKSDFYELAYQILKTIDFVNMNRGSTQPLITQSDLKKVPIHIPTKAELFDFEDTVGSFMNRYEANILENESLTKIHDALLPKLMSGKLSVSN